VSSAVAPPEDRDLRRALSLVKLLRDPALPGLLLMGAIVVAGFGALAFGWYGTARTIYVPLQLPEILSGGLGGLALVGAGAALFDLQLARLYAARERRVVDQVLDEVAELVALGPEIRRRVKRGGRPSS
jgi:hypothetical protein